MPLSNASSAMLPPPSHGSGSGWFATPFLQDSFIPNFTPVYPDAIHALRCADRMPLEDIFILPVRLDKCPVPRSIAAHTQYVDLFPDWEIGIDAINQCDSPRDDGAREPASRGLTPSLPSFFRIELDSFESGSISRYFSYAVRAAALSPSLVLVSPRRR